MHKSVAITVVSKYCSLAAQNNVLTSVSEGCTTTLNLKPQQPLAVIAEHSEL